MSLNLLYCLLGQDWLIPASTTDIDDNTACSQETHPHYCSNVIYTWISQGDRVFEDAVGFDFLHEQGLPLEIHNRHKSFAYSFWRAES